MWRKTTEAKPNPAASKTPGPASTTETPTQTQATTQQASTAPAVANAASTPANPASKPANQPPANGTTTAPAQAASPASAAPTQGKSAPVSAAPQAASVPPREPVRAEEPSTISAGLKIKGEITGTSDLTIDGETQGKVRLTNGRVTVGASGRVIADIDAREIVVNGTVQGNLKATDSVRLGPSGHVEGSILTARIGIEDGARLRGNVEMIRAGQTDSTPAQAARAASASNSQDSD